MYAIEHIKNSQKGSHDETKEQLQAQQCVFIVNV